MTYRFPIAFAVLMAAALPLQAAETSEPPSLIKSAQEVHLEDFLWINRPVVVFADSAADPRFVQQMALLIKGQDDLADRDVVILTDTDPSILSELRETLRPRGFMLALIGKDGQVKLRKPQPWSVRELSRTIDKMPMRQQEVRDRRVPPAE